MGESVEGVRTFLERGPFGPLEESADSFLRAYGISSGDGRSAERAIEVLSRIAARRVFP